jgi:transketolase
MAAIINGITLHGPTRAYGGTFLTFSDYMRPAVRLASLMEVPSIFVWTHDSIGLGEDGPTHQPVGLVLTRQNLPTLAGTAELAVDGVARGGYVLADAGAGRQEVVLLATGSELLLAVAARDVLEGEGVPTRVVSLPCVEWFDAQDQAYRDTVLPPDVKARVVVEAGVAQPWYRFAGDTGRIVSIEHYGASADYQTLFREFGFTADAVVEAARRSRQAQKG